MSEKDRRFLLRTILCITLIYCTIITILSIIKTEHSFSLISIVPFTISVFIFILRLKTTATICINKIGMKIEHQFPWGLNQLLKTKYTLTWADIVDIKVLTPLGRFAEQTSLESEEDYLRALTSVKWLIILENGKIATIFPFLCESPAQALPFSTKGIFKTKRIPLDTEEHLKKLKHLYKNWPFIKEVSKYNIPIPPFDFSKSEDPSTKDILPTKRLKAGFVLGACILLGFLFSITHPQDNYIQNIDTFFTPICAGIFLSILSILWMKNDQPKPKKTPLICVTAFIGISTALACWPLLTRLNNLGGENASEQRYVIHQNTLVADKTDNKTSSCHQNIEHPGIQSPLASLKEGSKITLRTKKGLFGLCQYSIEGP